MLIIIKFDYFEGNSKSVGKKKKGKKKAQNHQTNQKH